MSTDPGALFLVLLRWSHVAALLSLFGSLLFLVAVAPATRRGDAEHAMMIDPRLARLARAAAGLALLLGAAWYAAETAAIAGVTSASAIIGFLPVIGLHTQFGHWLALRLL